MSTMTKNPPIRIRRQKTEPAPSSPAPPEPTWPAYPGLAPAAPPAPAPPKPKPKPKPAPKPVPTVAVKKGPAKTPPKPRPPLVRVENPRRLRIRSKEHRKLGGFVIASPAWGSPFRVKEIDGRWFVVWIGDDQRLERHKPDGWEDIPCGNRLEAAQLALEAFRDWLTSKSSAGLFDHARAILRGYNLVCFCPHDYPCHGDVLLASSTSNQRTQASLSFDSTPLR